MGQPYKRGGAGEERQGDSFQRDDSGEVTVGAAALTEVERLETAIGLIRKGEVIQAAEILEQSHNPLTLENAANCRRSASGSNEFLDVMLVDCLENQLRVERTFEPSRSGHRSPSASRNDERADQAADPDPGPTGQIRKCSVCGIGIHAGNRFIRRISPLDCYRSFEHVRDAITGKTAINTAVENQSEAVCERCMLNTLPRWIKSAGNAGLLIATNREKRVAEAGELCPQCLEPASTLLWGVFNDGRNLHGWFWWCDDCLAKWWYSPEKLPGERPPYHTEAERRRFEQVRQQREEAEKKRAEDERKSRTEAEKSKISEAVTKRAEKERRKRIQAKRKKENKCINCGYRLGVFDRIFRRIRHRTCTAFTDESKQHENAGRYEDLFADAEFRRLESAGEPSFSKEEFRYFVHDGRRVFMAGAQPHVQKVERMGNYPPEAATPISPPESPELIAGPSNATARRVVVNFKSDDGDLNQWLKNHTSRAKAQDLIPTIEFYGDWCGACRMLRESFNHPLIADALAQTYIMQVELNEHASQIVALGFHVSVIPVFFILDETGRRTGPKIDGGAWGDNIPENMRPPLKAFFDEFRARAS